VLYNGHFLGPNECLVEPNCTGYAVMQPDGNFVFYIGKSYNSEKPGEVVWASGTTKGTGKICTRLIFKFDNKVSVKLTLAKVRIFIQVKDTQVLKIRIISVIRLKIWGLSARSVGQLEVEGKPKRKHCLS